MNARNMTDDQLDRAIDFMLDGPRAQVMAPRVQTFYASDLIETAAWVRDDASRPPPLGTGLPGNYTFVRAALEQAQGRVRVIESRRVIERYPATLAPWWRRRAGFASLSLPAAAAALLVFAGIGGAAAVSIAGRDKPVPSPTPAAIVGSGASADAPAAPAKPPTGSEAAGSSDSGFSAGAAVRRLTAEAVPLRRPPPVTTLGVVHAFHGASFKLVRGDGATSVTFDGETIVSGVLADGAQVVVQGVQTAEKTLRAYSVVVSEAPAADRTVPPSAKKDGQNGAPANRTPDAASDENRASPAGERVPPGRSGDPRARGWH